MITLLIHGFGAMGKIVYQEAQKDPQIQIVAIVEPSGQNHVTGNTPLLCDLAAAPAADIVIDFSHPDFLNNVLQYGETHQAKLVLATTGYQESQLAQIAKTAESMAIFQSYNMSLGLRMLLEALQVLAPQAKGHYDIEIEERHHRKKIDAPSGTAWLIFRTLAKLLPGKKAVLNRSDSKQARKDDEIGIVALRGGTIFGEHTVLFAGEDELIEIKHTALSKRIFATGALSAAQFLLDKQKGLYNLDNIVAHSNQ